MKFLRQGLLFFSILISIFFHQCQSNKAVAIPHAANLIWSDEFDYKGLPDTTKWGYDIGESGWGNHEWQYYTEKRLENARVENGLLIIEARKEPFGKMQYTSARIATKNKGDWKYGRIEIRAKLPRGRGTWPALWMLSTDWKYGGWPESGEIDIMEHVGYDQNQVHASVHTKDYYHIIGTQKTAITQVPTASDSFHIYGMEWRENFITISVDNQTYFRFPKESDDFRKWPFAERFHLLFNVAVGGDWGGSKGVDETIFPQKMLVDWVRVYR
jgi:beta-glucanase (GH16 family)